MADSRERSWYSVAEVAQVLGVSRTTVWRWIRAGRLPARRVGPRTLRVERRAVDRVMEPRAIPAERAVVVAGRAGALDSRAEESATDTRALSSRRATPAERAAIFATHDSEGAREILSRTMGSCPDLDAEAIIASIYRGREEGSRN